MRSPSKRARVAALFAEIGPIFRAAARRRSSFYFIVLEVALGLTGVALCLEVGIYLLTLQPPRTGMEIDRVVVVRANRIGSPGPREAVPAAESALRSLEGVEAAAWVDTEPFNTDRTPDFAAVPDGAPTIAWTVIGSEGVLDVLGVRVTEGRAFSPEDHSAQRPTAVLSHALAARLFPGRSAIGETLVLESKHTATIVGVSDTLLLKPAGYPDAGVAAILAGQPDRRKVQMYLVRSEPSRRDAVAAAAKAALTDGRHVATSARLEDLYLVEANESAGAFVAGGVAVAMLLIIMLGWTGTVSFLVAERTRQIGVRRALGATRGDVMRYFLLENVVVTTVGIAVGIPLVVVHYWITAPKLGLIGVHWLLGPMGFGMALFWATGILSAILPARRASLIPPIAATRSL